jgi:hypothetical protein
MNTLIFGVDRLPLLLLLDDGLRRTLPCKRRTAAAEYSIGVRGLNSSLLPPSICHLGRLSPSPNSMKAAWCVGNSVLSVFVGVLRVSESMTISSLPCPFGNSVPSHSVGPDRELLLCYFLVYSISMGIAVLRCFESRYLEEFSRRTWQSFSFYPFSYP